jgi:hypothetical protein
MKTTSRIGTRYMISIVEWVGIASFGIGAGGMYGHYYNNELLFRWHFDKGTDVGMAFSTTVVIAIIGIGLIATSIILKRHEQHIQQIQPR